MLKRISAFILALTMLCVTACSNDNSSDTSKADSSSSVSEQETDSSSDDSDDSSEADSSTKDSDSSEDDSSSKAESTTKKVDSSSNSDTSSKTTTKTTANTTPAVYTQPTQRTTSKATVKTTAKPVTTTTKKVVTTTTAKQNTISYEKPSGLTRLEDAVWELHTPKNHYNVTYRNIVRDELIKYGQAYCKSNPECFKYFTLNTKLYPYYDKNGKPLYAPCDMKGNVIAVGSNVEFPDDDHISCFSSYAEVTQSERLSTVRSFINRMYLLIERVLCNALRHGIANMEWYITYGDEYYGIDWNVMAHIPDGDWIEF